jgi:aryl-alcohol dehydrogenase-like predicted oxidoreductase
MPSNALRTRTLGSSDLLVSEVGLGGNTFGPPRLDEDQTARVLDAALDMGVNFVDTAILYGGGKSEEFIASGLGSRRDRMVIATKFNLIGLDNQTASDRIISHAEESLRKLRTDRIDLLQIHQPNPATSAHEILSALDTLVTAGKVRAIGASNYSSWRLAEAALVARELGSATFVSVQNYMHLFARQSEPEVIPFCAEFGLSMLPYRPVAAEPVAARSSPP